MWQALIPALGGVIGKVVDRAVPDANAAAELKAQVMAALLANAERELSGAVEIIRAEAGGESWLQRNWRPILMLTFTALIVCRWLGLSAPNLDAALEMKLFEIVQLGLGGYVIGRSAEKIAVTWKSGDK